MYILGEYDDEIQHFYQFCEDKFQYEEPDSNDYEELAKKSVAEHKTKSDVGIIQINNQTKTIFRIFIAS